MDSRKESEIHLPTWLTPAALVLFMSGIGMYVRTTSAEEAEMLVRAHTTIAAGRWGSLEVAREEHEIKLQLITQDLTAIKKIAQDADENSERNYRLLNRIADTLNVPTPD